MSTLGRLGNNENEHNSSSSSSSSSSQTGNRLWQWQRPLGGRSRAMSSADKAGQTSRRVRFVAHVCNSLNAEV
jgi:outer membrane protein TolC